jgi:pimeloyl-ACP methyl ester carboxylesterase
MSPQTKPSIVFAHGIWADGSCFNKVIPTLQAEGYEVFAAQYGLDTNVEDVAATLRTLGRVSSPAILVGHSYGGAVITAAGTDDRVVGLVYICALGPDETETSQGQQDKFPVTDIFHHVDVADGRAWMQPSGAQYFCGDLSEADQKLVYATHFAPAADLFLHNAPGVAWRTKPSWAIKVTKEKPVASEQVLDIPVRRHVLTSERPFQVVLDGIFGGISQPDIGALFAKLAASTSYEELSALVRQAQGSAGLMRFLQLDLDTVLALDPQARQAGRRLVRLIAGNPVTMGQMTRHLPAAGSYAPVTILIQDLPDGGTQVAYDTVASAIAPYGDAAASQVAERLDTEVLSLLHHATGIPPTA